MKRNSYASSQTLLAMLLVVAITLGFLFPTPKFTGPQVAAVISISNPFVYTFNTIGTLHESPSSGESSSPYWWLNSGGKMILKDDVGQTVHGDLAIWDKWRILYASSNSLDTDGGKHPQNIFRLVTKNTAADQRVESLFKIDADNWSQSPNRNASNGLLLMTRYQDSNNLYYAGVRVDGMAIIKKKARGTYTTLAQKQVFTGTYSREGLVNLIPHNEWLGLRVDSTTNTDGTVTIQLSMKRADGVWTKILETKDGTASTGSALKGGGSAGIRTDFMDVSFESFRFQAL